MTSSAAELSSLASTLDELTRRITAIADAYVAADHEELALELYAAERALVGAHRRLARVGEADRRLAGGHRR